MTDERVDRRTALRLAVAGLLGAPSALGLAGCGGGGSGTGAVAAAARRRSVGVVAASPYAPWPALRTALVAAGARRRAELSLADEALDAAGQRRAIERWSGPDGLGAIVLAPVDASVAGAARKAANAGTPVVGLLAPVPGGAATVDLDLAGSARTLLGAVDGRWTRPASVLLVRPTAPAPVPLPFAPVARRAADALRAALAPRGALAAEVPALAAADAEPAVATALAALAGVRLVLCVDDGAATGAVRAVARAGSDAVVACLAPAGATDATLLRPLAAGRGTLRALVAPELDELADVVLGTSLAAAGGRPRSARCPTVLARPGSAEARALRRGPRPA